MGISISQLLIILALVILIFGTKKLKNLGGDIGSAIKSFKSAMKDGAEDDSMNKQIDKEDDIVEGKASSKTRDKV
jgi:sec-independent protein translocase protein TatA